MHCFSFHYYPLTLLVFSKVNYLVKENNLSGVHLFADNAWNSEFIKAYNINSIPRYLLLDIDGTIITSDAPRPSNSELSQKIKSLKPAKGKEIHITDAIQLLINDKEKFVAHNFEGKYLDCGTMSGYINSSKEIGKI